MDLILQEVFDKALLLYRLLILKHGNKITIFVIITTFLSVRSMKIVVNGQSSNVREINAGVIQSSLLGPTLFLHFINDLPGKILRSLIHMMMPQFMEASLKTQIYKALQLIFLLA